MKKGDQIEYIGYTIEMCTNNDGIVLIGPDGSHRGNFGTNEMLAKKHAVLEYLISKGSRFSTQLIRWIENSGTCHEYYALERLLKKDGFDVPGEITKTEDMNASILFNGVKMYEKKEMEDADQIAKDLEVRQDTAEAIVNMLEVGVKHKDKKLILMAYNISESDAFSWDGLDLEFKNWDRLVTKANDILQ